MSSIFKSVRVAHTRIQAVKRTSTASQPISASINSYRCFSASAICKQLPLAIQTSTVPIKGTDPLRSYGGLGSAKRLPEFSLQNKVVLISGGVGGVGLHQSEALMEAGATGRSQTIYPLE